MEHSSPNSYFIDLSWIITKRAKVIFLFLQQRWELCTTQVIQVALPQHLLGSESNPCAAPQSHAS